uniref:Transcriptional factor DELLA N-terminal domain-containing protein n=1 Tax=Lactuca sativa TaxID=4236 RepID=A0A9R1UH17_LACSA|nr:hypothetical protein LSAT_V11C900458010 [Lactuca sativa]
MYIDPSLSSSSFSISFFSLIITSTIIVPPVTNAQIMPPIHTLLNHTPFPDPEQDVGINELLVMLSYKLKLSDMADVVQKIEYLEGVLGNEDGLS